MEVANSVNEKLMSGAEKNRRRGILSETQTGSRTLDDHLRHIRSANWTSTSLGALESWPQDLIQLCHVCLLDSQPRLLVIGSERAMFYNEAYSEICGDRHPSALGQPLADVWDDLALESVLTPLKNAEATGRRVEIKNRALVYERNGFVELVYLSWTIIPLFGSTPGIQITLVDVTETLLAEKRRDALRALSTAWNVVKDPHEFWQSIPTSLALDPFLFPFAFLYVADPEVEPRSSIDISSVPTHKMRFRLKGAIGDLEITSTLPSELDSDHFTIFSSLRDSILIKPDETPTPFRSSSMRNCILCPIRSNRSPKVIAYLYLGKDANRPFNDNYREWVNEFTRCLGNAATSVLLADEEKRKQQYRAAQAAREQHLLATALANRDREAVAVTGQFQRTLKVVDMAGVGIFEYDMEGRLIYGNDAFCAMSHCRPENMHGDKLAFLDLTYPEDAEYLLTKWKCAAAGKSVTFEMRYKTPDGQGIWVQAAVVPVLENGVVTSVSGCTTDIHDTKMRETESVQRLQALERAKAWEQKFANFAGMAPIAIYFGTESQRLSYCNRAWYEMTGHTVVPFDQIDWVSIVHEEDVGLVRNRWQQVFDTAKTVSAQFRLRKKWADRNGVTMGPVWVTASALPEYKEDGSVKGIIGTMLDISALKFAETVQQMKVQEAMEAKRQSSNFIDMVSQNPLGAVFHCSDAAQETLSEMTALADRLGETKQSRIGEQLHELITSAIDSTSTIISCSQHQKRIVDDILVLSKLDSNLLQIIPTAVKVSTMLHDVEKMFEAEAERGEVQLIAEAHESLKQLDVTWAMLDPGRVQQVLINLLTNAIKFCKKKEQRKVTIRVGASRIRPSENVLPNIDFVVAHSLHDGLYDDPQFEPHSFYLWFSVEDTGCGMSVDEKSRIFARFTQGSPRTEKEYGGSGLGLFISRELSELQGGEIGVASEPGVGSTFAFFIKTRHTDDPAIATSHNLPIHLKQDIKTKREDINILVVEDNAVNQKLLLQQLTKHGFSVTTADNGLEALSHLRKTKFWRSNPASSPSLSVILMDIEMPLMDGLQATREIRQYERDGKLTGHIPIIAVSANARQEQREMAMESGMDDSISKPFRIVDLVPKIERLAGWT
ncbi:hypothetical protein E4T38_05252 [Aureobasidium subglaciale]|nr:hypothetical protein E4T38_05252 [Aureobasidium subglaciale]KAI5220312.1 hypothetical protein E4T40_06016 [Aureobasidium subglaciale]KAI5222878.1 hypothetical protein E4T41_06442 [Aureobasidium subglaciale]KAI5260124.1 hypothetical protein E4T46_06324 [Aureobasidium subglaciale]